MKKLLYLIVIAALLYLAWTKLIQPMVGAGKGVSQFYFGSPAIPDK